MPSPMLGLEDTGPVCSLTAVRAGSRGVTRRVREDPQEERDPPWQTWTAAQGREQCGRGQKAAASS